MRSAVPWSDMPSAEQAHLLRKQVLLLSKEAWNFLSPLDSSQAAAAAAAEVICILHALRACVPLLTH